MVVGTRPEAIKLAPVARALIARGCVPSLFLTGQHPGLDLAAFGFPAIPASTLACVSGGDPHHFAEMVADALAPHLGGAALVLVQGDTASALGGALAGDRAGLAVGHVEAGLRSHDRLRPWPEEGFRIAIDRLGGLLFAPTELSAANLRRERVKGAIHVTGNTAVDAAIARTRPNIQVKEKKARPRLLVTCHRRESWGDGLRSIAAALTEIARDGGAEVDFVLHPNPAVASAMQSLLAGVGGVELRPPCGHAEMLEMLESADLVLTDSGGLQEEAPLLGIPLLVLRDRTERPEAIAFGNVALVGTDTGRIVASVRRLQADPAARARMRRAAAPHGDGKAGERIANLCVDWLTERRMSDEMVTPTGLEPVFSP